MKTSISVIAYNRPAAPCACKSQCRLAPRFLHANLVTPPLLTTRASSIPSYCYHVFSGGWYGWIVLPVSGFVTASSTKCLILLATDWPVLHLPFPNGPGVALSVQCFRSRSTTSPGSADIIFFANCIGRAPTCAPRPMLDFPPVPLILFSPSDTCLLGATRFRSCRRRSA